MGGTRGLATREIRDLRAPRSGYSEYHTSHLQAFLGLASLFFPWLFLEEAEIRNSQGSFRWLIPPWWEIVVTVQSITKEHWGGGKGEGLTRFQADSLAAFRPLLGPRWTRNSDKAIILPCLGEPSPKPERLG